MTYSKTERHQLSDRFEAALNRVIDLARMGAPRRNAHANVMVFYVRLQGKLSDNEVRELLAEWEEFVKVQAL